MSDFMETQALKEAKKEPEFRSDAEAPAQEKRLNAEEQRLLADRNGTENWRKWGPYLSERQWGTVREDYSKDGNAWSYFPHSQSHRRAYRWGEDGLAGISDDQQRICLALALWNGQDPILKERLFGLANQQGNHGEDVKELYYYLDATPTHSYLKMLYKYPQLAFPYHELVAKNQQRGRLDPEFEILDTGIFDDNRYFDVFVEYAKATPYDILCRITVANRGPDNATIHVLPTIWYRNTWSWEVNGVRPVITPENDGTVQLTHPEWDDYRFHFETETSYGVKPELLFTENDTNLPALFNDHAPGPFKDAFHEYLVHGRREALSAECKGTKFAPCYRLDIPPGQEAVIRLRLRHESEPEVSAFDHFDEIFRQRIEEATEFFVDLPGKGASEDARRIQRQAIAGLIWTKQFYNYDVWRWLKGDVPAQPAPPPERWHLRNADWEHLKNADVISMPDKWEYPWYAAWDLAFHMVPFAVVDAEFAKRQLLLLCKEWYMHPNGQIPAYEWNFSDVNPPVHAWASWRVFQIDRNQRKERGEKADYLFLEKVFHKLMLNFTWWVNRKDAAGLNIFQGGFLGLDNIGVFDRSQPLPTGGHINQADGTAWMAMYSLNLMRMALELAQVNPAYEDIATKFFEHFLAIAKAMTNMAGQNIGLWNEEDEFYYDELTLPDQSIIPLKVRSMVGLIPLFAVETLEPELLANVPDFSRRLRWVLAHRPDLAVLVSRWYEPGRGERRLLSLLRGHRIKKVLRRMLDPNEFLSDYGIRSLSKYHEQNPYSFEIDCCKQTVRYLPGESDSGMFGGNSNWRGPIWFPVNYLIIESLQRFHHYFGDDFKVECPTGSGRMCSLLEVSQEIARRLCRIFLRDAQGRRPCFGDQPKLQQDPHFKDCLLFHEYFHGDNGTGLGASHQTGWTALVAKLLRPRRGEQNIFFEEAPQRSVSSEQPGVSVGIPVPK